MRPEEQPWGGDRAAVPLSWYDTRARPPRLRWSGAVRRRDTLDALACLSLSALCFSQASSEMLFRADRQFYDRVPLGAPTLVAFIVNVVALAAAGLLGLRAIRRVRRSWVHRLAAVAAAAALLVALNFTRITYGAIASLADSIPGVGLVLLAVAILAASFGWPRPALRAVRRAALIVAPVAVITLTHALWMFLELAAGPVWRRVELVQLKTDPPSLRRVVWLVLEGLDQRLAFEERPPGLELPELDRLRRESLYADAARPPAGVDDVSMPALITGRPVVAVTPLGPHELDLTFADGKRAKWRTHPNVFARARAFGYDTALIGWHLPYPRVLGTALGLVDWRPSLAYEQTRGDTLREALWNQWESLVPPVHRRRLLVQRVAEIGELGLRAATDGRFGLVLLHLPLPEPPGIYDRTTGRLTWRNFAGAEAEYLDNLALVDRIVGDLRRGLDRARLLDRTWMIVTSARGRPGPKPDDGPIDHRVPFLLRPPEGGRTVHVDGRFGTLATHDLVLAILRGSIADATGAADWLARNPSPPPRDYTSTGRPVY